MPLHLEIFAVPIYATCKGFFGQTGRLGVERMENQGLISRVQSETDKRKTLLFLTEKAHALKGEYDSVSDEMGSIYYKGFSEEEITRFEECLDRIRKNLEEWQKS